MYYNSLGLTSEQSLTQVVPMWRLISDNKYWTASTYDEAVDAVPLDVVKKVYEWAAKQVILQAPFPSDPSGATTASWYYIGSVAATQKLQAADKAAKPVSALPFEETLNRSYVLIDKEALATPQISANDEKAIFQALVTNNPNQAMGLAKHGGTESGKMAIIAPVVNLQEALKVGAEKCAKFTAIYDFLTDTCSGPFCPVKDSGIVKSGQQALASWAAQAAKASGYGTDPSDFDGKPANPRFVATLLLFQATVPWLRKTGTLDEVTLARLYTWRERNA